MQHWNGPVYRVFILTDREDGPSSMSWAVETDGLVYEAGTEAQLDGVGDAGPDLKPDAVLLDIDSLSDHSSQRLVSLCRRMGLPIMAVVSRDNFVAYDTSMNWDDFIVQPFQSAELLARLAQLTSRKRGVPSDNIISIGDLIIDLERYEVRLGSKRVLLTYKEYQLLVLLASNAGKVYTRDSLLSQVWGYDYFGGTRTVDVHIRRLRSKIEGPGYSFIETIWNVGYRFRAQP